MGVFGGAWVGTDAGPQRPRSPRQAAVLAHLLLTPGQPVTFEAIADSVWPDQPFDDVKNSLRVHVSNLRKWLRDSCSQDAADAVETLKNAYRLNIAPDRVDWQRFSETITEGQLALAGGETIRSIELLRSALDLWAEPFAELTDHDAAGAQQVLLNARRELAQDELIEAQLRAGAASDVVATLEARTLTHPYREHAHRQLMCALYATGRQAEALDVYRRLYRTLRDDLGIEPGPQIKATQAAVLAQELEVAEIADGMPSASSDTTSVADLVGRDGELSTVLDAIDRPGFVVLWGEAGAGKSRLLHEVSDLTARSNVPRRWVGCVAQRDQSTAPLWAIRNALGLDPDSGAADAFDLNDELVREISRVPGTVVVFDDFQWADEATVDFVGQLASSTRHGATIVMALRSAEVDTAGKPGQIATTLSRRPDATTLTLAPLDLDAVTQLADACGSSLPPPAVLERSGGNALFVTELLRSEHLVGATEDVPRGVSALLADRLEGAGEAAARVLSVAAVIGQQFEVDLLIRIADQSVEEIIDGVDAGRTLGMVTSGTDGGPVFTHGLIVDAFAARLTDLERCRLHDRIATVLDRRASTSNGGPERAMHHAVASLPLGDPSRAVRLAQQSGQVSAVRLAYADARSRYVAALSAADLLDDDSRDALMPTLIRDLGASEVRAGETESGRRNLRHAIELATARGDDAVALSAAVALVEGPSPLSGADDDTIRCVTDAVEATTGDVTVERSKLLSWLGGARYFTHDLAHCRELTDEAIRIADALRDPQAAAFARFGKWQASLGPDDVDERRVLAAEIRSYADASGSLAFVNSGYTMGTSTAIDLGDLAAARRLNAEAAERIVGMAPSRFRWATDGNDVIFAIADGRFDDAESAARQTYERANGPDTGVNASNALITFGAHLVNIRLLQGRGAEAVAILEQHADAAPDLIAYRAGWVAGLAHGQDQRSPQLVAELIDDVIVARNDVLTTVSLACAADAVWSLLGSERAIADSTAAGRLADRITPLAHLHAHLNTYGPSGVYFGSLLHSLAQALTGAGDFDQAIGAFEAAITENGRAGASGFETRSAAALERLHEIITDGVRPPS